MELVKACDLQVKRLQLSNLAEQLILLKYMIVKMIQLFIMMQLCHVVAHMDQLALCCDARHVLRT